MDVEDNFLKVAIKLKIADLQSDKHFKDLDALSNPLEWLDSGS